MNTQGHAIRTFGYLTCLTALLAVLSACASHEPQFPKPKLKPGERIQGNYIVTDNGYRLFKKQTFAQFLREHRYTASVYRVYRAEKQGEAGNHNARVWLRRTLKIPAKYTWDPRKLRADLLAKANAGDVDARLYLARLDGFGLFGMTVDRTQAFDWVVKHTVRGDLELPKNLDSVAPLDTYYAMYIYSPYDTALNEWHGLALDLVNHWVWPSFKLKRIFGELRASTWLWNQAHDTQPKDKLRQAMKDLRPLLRRGDRRALLLMAQLSLDCDEQLDPRNDRGDVLTDVMARPCFKRFFYWSRLAALHGAPDAELHVVQMYSHGIGVPVDFGAAAWWYARLLKRPDAATYKAALSHFADNTFVLYPKAYKTDAGFKKREFVNGAALTGIKCAGTKHAKACLQQLADGGNAKAMWELGLLYAHAPVDGSPAKARAEAWYRRAAGTGNPWAQYLLAKKYARGTFGKPSLATAQQWDKRASTKLQAAIAALADIKREQMQAHGATTEQINKAVIPLYRKAVLGDEVHIGLAGAYFYLGTYELESVQNSGFNGKTLQHAIEHLSNATDLLPLQSPRYLLALAWMKDMVTDRTLDWRPRDWKSRNAVIYSIDFKRAEKLARQIALTQGGKEITNKLNRINNAFEQARLADLPKPTEIQGPTSVWQAIIQGLVQGLPALERSEEDFHEESSVWHSHASHDLDVDTCAEQYLLQDEADSGLAPADAPTPSAQCN